MTKLLIREICCLLLHHENLAHTIYVMIFFFSAVKIENFIGKKMKFLIFMLKTSIVGTHNQCFGPKIRKKGIPWQTQVLLYKSGV